MNPAYHPEPKGRSVARQRRLGDGILLRCPTCQQIPFFTVEPMTGRVLETCRCGPHIVTQERT